MKLTPLGFAVRQAPPTYDGPAPDETGGESIERRKVVLCIGRAAPIG
jgi:hypothetical protein